MTTPHQPLADVAHTIAPVGATVSHLCTSGVGTFSIERPASDSSDAIAYALKVFNEPPGDGRSPTEFGALLQIDDPNVVRYRDVGTQRHGDGVYRWLAMDLVEGSSLAQLLAEDGLVPDLATAVRLLREAISGAAALWSVGTTHRDLVADNVMITPSGGVVIVDLGPAQTDATRAPGPADVAPDRETRLGDWRADQFALGLLGCQLATGAEPFGAHQDGRQGAQVDAQSIMRLAHDGNRSLPQELTNILATMLAPQPENRYADPGTLQADLARVARAVGSNGSPWFSIEPRERTCRRQR